MHQSLDTSYKGILKMSLPIALGAFIQFVVVLTDNTFLSQVNSEMMSGAGNAGLIYISLLMIIMGLSSGVQIMIARRKGENRPSEIGKLTINALIIGAVFSVIIYFLFYTARVFYFESWIDSPSIRGYMDSFLNIRSLGILFYFITLIIIAFYSGIARTTILIYTTFLTAGINIFLDYTLIFGHFGAPQLGIEGAAWATVVAELITTIFVLFYVILDKKNIPYNLNNALRKLYVSSTMKILKISSPLILQFCLSLSTWTIFFFFVEKMGAVELQVSHVIRNLYMLVFIPAMGLGQTTKTFVSTLIAEKRQDELATIMKRLIGMNLIGILFVTHGFWMYPDFIFSWFNVDPAMFDIAGKALFVVFLSSFFIGFSAILINSILGSGKTLAGLIIELISVVIYLGLTYFIIIVWEQPLHIVWLCDGIYFLTIIVFSLIVLKNSNWKYHSI